MIERRRKKALFCSAGSSLALVRSLALQRTDSSSSAIAVKAGWKARPPSWMLAFGDADVEIYSFEEMAVQYRSEQCNRTQRRRQPTGF